MFLLSANNFLSFWMSLELNLVLFMGLLVQLETSTGVSAVPVFKYFVVQGVGSSILFLSLLGVGALGDMFSKLFLLGASVKGGLAPFHDWFLSMSETLNWESFFLLSSVQKIGPLLCIGYMYNYQVVSALALLSTFISVLGALENFEFRSVLALSSVFNSGWLSCVSSCGSQFLAAFLSYTVGMLLICGSLFSSSKKYTSQMLFTTSSRALMVSAALAVFNLSGIPPFFGAYVKLLVLSMLIQVTSWGMLVIFSLASVVWIYFYISVVYSMMTGGSSYLGLLENPLSKSASVSVVLLFLSLAVFF